MEGVRSSGTPEIESVKAAEDFAVVEKQQICIQNFVKYFLELPLPFLSSLVYDNTCPIYCAYRQCSNNILCVKVRMCNGERYKDECN